MSIFLPNNVFTRILSSCFPDDLKSKVSFLPSSQITQNIESDNSSIGLISVMDLLKHKELFVSGNYGISFEGSLCNSYIYYFTEEKSVTKIGLSGDVSSVEVILSKIVFKEMYGSDLEIEIVTNLSKAGEKNLLLIGDENFNNERFLKGISFSEIMVDALSLPFVNYVFASGSKETLESFIKNLVRVETLFYDKVEEGRFDKNISAASEEYIKTNISSLVFKLDEQDREGINQILRLPYFHGMVNDIVEVKFI
ncbi:MAG: hypothetical protein A2V93_12340 [Ignavibacteria bacterium RBG_16_34_14]|nr:MAG: hypothetical protein A2V93_12340 [Ignavibacteria bacterium RBG_16_34_14]